MIEEEEQSPTLYDTTTKWIRTDWEGQGWVCQIGSKIFYITPDTLRFASMTLDEWNAISEDEKEVKIVDGKEPNGRGKSLSKGKPTRKRGNTRRRSGKYFRH